MVNSADQKKRVAQQKRKEDVMIQVVVVATDEKNTLACTTGMGMGVQEMVHLLLQVPSVNHNLEVVRASSESTSM